MLMLMEIDEMEQEDETAVSQANGDFRPKL